MSSRHHKDVLRGLLVAGVLVAVTSLAACRAASTADTPGVTGATTGTPAKVCSTTPTAGTSVRATAGDTLRVFLSVFNRRRDLARGWLAPESTLRIMAGLEPVTHLDLLRLDRHL